MPIIWLVFALKKLRNYIPDRKFCQMVSGIFISKHLYCVTVWGGIWDLPDQQIQNRRNTSISKHAVRQLQVMQNKIMRLMSGMDFNTPTKDLCYHTNQLSVHQLMAYHICCQVYKIKDTKLPVYHYSRLFNNTDNQNIGLGNRVRKGETKRV